MRVALLEKERDHMAEKFERVAEQVAELHELMTQAKGARWAILSVVAVAGFLAGKVGSMSGLFGIK